MKNKLILSFFLFLIFFNISISQKKELTYEQAYENSEPRLLQPLPDIKGWLDDDSYLERNENQILKVNPITGEKSEYIDFNEINKKLTEDFKAEQVFTFTPDYKKFLFKNYGNLFFFYPVKSEFKQLTFTLSEEMNPKLSPDGKYVAYTRDNNLCFIELNTGKQKQLTFDGSDIIYNGWASWVYYEEILGRASQYAAFWWSPNSEFLAFLRFDDSPVPKFTLFNADSLHGTVENQRYPKAGDPNPIVKLGVIEIKTGKIIWFDGSENEDKYIAAPHWTDDSNSLIYQIINRSQNILNVFSGDPLTGDTKKIYSEYQDSWVEFIEDIYTFKDSSGFIVRTDVDGWFHLYYYDMDGNLKSRLSKGEWNVNSIAYVDEINKQVYYHGSVGIPTENHLYRVNLNGENTVQLTKYPGTHNCTFSPGGKFFIDNFSSITQTPKLILCWNDGDVIRTLGDRKSQAFDDYKLGKVELLTIPADSGYKLPLSWILPPDFDSSRKYPVIFNVYGGPSSRSVSNSFRASRNLSDYYLAQNGIIVISCDNRGSGHFGKKGMAEMYRNLGKWEINDLISAVKWLRKLPFVDSTKIGITGGSYGGYVTLMALTYGAEYFTHGIAEFSVTDWKLYDDVYTERYMDKPSENPEGYTFASVLTHADKLKGKLLITHGTMDDNVHLQNTIILIDKLENLGKKFELMLYPNERHGFRSEKRKYSNKINLNFWFKNFFGREFNNNH